MQFKFERCDGVDGGWTHCSWNGGSRENDWLVLLRERLAGAPLSCVSILDWIVVLDRLLL